MKNLLEDAFDNDFQVLFKKTGIRGHFLMAVYYDDPEGKRHQQVGFVKWYMCNDHYLNQFGQELLQKLKVQLMELGVKH